MKYLLILLLLVSYTSTAKPHVYDIERKKYYNSHYYKKHVRHHKRKGWKNDVVKDVIVPLTAVVLLHDALTRDKKKDCKVTKVKVVDKDGKVVDEYKEVRCEK